MAVKVALKKVERELFLRLPTILAIQAAQVRRRRKSESALKGILVLRLDGIGDCVMTLPMLDSLRGCYPNAVITLITQASAEPLFRESTLVDELLVIPTVQNCWIPNRLNTLRAATKLFSSKLRNRSFDLVLNPRWDTDSYCATFLCALTNATEIVGYEDATSVQKRSWNRGFQRAYTRVLRAGPPQHEVLRNLDVTRAFKCRSGSSQPTIVITKVRREQAEKWLGSARGVRIALGLSASEAKKRWQAAQYVSVLVALQAQMDLSLVILADRDTEPIAQELASKFPTARVAVNMPLIQGAAVLNLCDVFLGSDSGLGHIAAAVGCRTVTISWCSKMPNPAHSSSPARWRPYGNFSVVVQPAAPLSGCEDGCVSKEAHCILKVDQQEVVASVLALLCQPRHSFMDSCNTDSRHL